MKRKNSLMRILKEAIASHKILSALVLLLIIFSAFASVYGSLFMQKLVDDYITPLSTQTNPDFTPLLKALFQLMGIFLTGVLATWLYRFFCVTISVGALKTIRDDLFEHMETLPIKYFDTHAHGDIMSVYTNDIDTLRQVLSESIPMALSSFITILSVSISMIVLNLPMACVTFFIGFCMIYVSKKVSMKSGKYFKMQQNSLGIVNGYIEEMMEGSKVIKVFNHEKISIEDFNTLNEELSHASSNANKYANVLMPILGNMGYISLVFNALFGTILAMNHIAGLTLGTIAAFVQLNRSFNGPIGQISMQLNAIVMAQAGAERICRLKDEVSEVNEGRVTLVNMKQFNGEWIECHENTGHWFWKHPRKDGVAYVELKGDVRFEDVNFSYTPKKTILHHINLFAKPGQKIAFVGATGAGKTTITNLINRFYDIQSGSITYDGIDVKLIKKEDLRRSLGIVLQDVNLFTGTIMDNIRYGNLEASDEECIAAAKLANAHDFIKHLEHGYQTQIDGSGESLSQGQRQLISIARAAVANPPVLILDEATSSIDTRTEKIVQDGMDKLMHGRTVFVIAHRLSTIQNANAIMVLDQGRIIERGNHEDLLEQKGIYYQLYTGAFEME